MALPIAPPMISPSPIVASRVRERAIQMPSAITATALTTIRAVCTNWLSFWSQPKLMPVFKASTRSKNGVTWTVPRPARSNTNSSQSFDAWSSASVRTAAVAPGSRRGRLLAMPDTYLARFFLVCFVLVFFFFTAGLCLAVPLAAFLAAFFTAFFTAFLAAFLAAFFFGACFADVLVVTAFLPGFSAAFFAGGAFGAALEDGAAFATVFLPRLFTPVVAARAFGMSSAGLASFTVFLPPFFRMLVAGAAFFPDGAFVIDTSRDAGEFSRSS